MISDADEAFPMYVSSYDLTAGGLNEYHVAFVGMIDEVRIYDYGMGDDLLLADYRYSAYKTKGDINADGAVNIRDLVFAKKYFSGVVVYTCIRNLDMNCDYILEAADMLILRKKLMGINLG